MFEIHLIPQRLLALVGVIGQAFKVYGRVFLSVRDEVGHCLGSWASRCGRSLEKLVRSCFCVFRTAGTTYNDLTEQSYCHNNERKFSFTN